MRVPARNLCSYGHHLQELALDSVAGGAAWQAQAQAQGELWAMQAQGVPWVGAWEGLLAGLLARVQAGSSVWVGPPLAQSQALAQAAQPQVGWCLPLVQRWGRWQPGIEQWWGCPQMPRMIWHPCTGHLLLGQHDANQRTLQGSVDLAQTGCKNA